MAHPALALPGRGLSGAARRLRPDAATRPPWERSVLDDLAMRRPWNLRVKAARLRSSLLRRTLEEGVTVVVVNWNTKEVLADVIRAVQHFSPPGTRLLVVDNGSGDGSRQMLERWPGIATLLLSSNAGHGVALDLATLASGTTVTVTLDSDAIPLAPDWLDAAVEPVRSGAAVLAGARSRRDFVHPIYLAVDTREFHRRRLSFQVHRQPGVPEGQVVWGENAWDTAEMMAGRLRPDEIAFVERTDNWAPGLPGMTAGDVVYHHGGLSRATTGRTSEEALAGWRQACDALGLSFLAADGTA